MRSEFDKGVDNFINDLFGGNTKRNEFDKAIDDLAGNIYNFLKGGKNGKDNKKSK